MQMSLLVQDKQFSVQSWHSLAPDLDSVAETAARGCSGVEVQVVLHEFSPSTM